MKKIILLTFILLVSCKTKQITVTETEYVHDSIYIDRVEKIIVPQTQIVEIDKPCDSLGNLKPFKTVLKSDKVNVTVEAKNGVLRAEIDLDSIKEVYQKEFESKLSDKSKVSETIITRYRIPKWCWWLILYAVLMTIWKFKKYIPYLNLLPF